MKKFTVTHIFAISVFAVITVLPCKIINNEEVIRRNKLFIEICEQYNVYYLDTHSVPSNDYGVLLADYTGASGYSLNESGCKQMTEYIRFHAHHAFVEE